MISFDAGARAEEKTFSHGIAHMLEHMIFKGTSKRSYLDISRQIGYLGGNTNAYTSYEGVCFYISVPYENIEPAMDILSDMVFNSTISEDEFKKEKEVVAEEEMSSKDDIQSEMHDEFCRKFFKDRLSIPIIGTPESISGFTVDEVRSFYKKFYTRSNAIVSLSSNNTKKEAKRLLTKYFGKQYGRMTSKIKIYEPEYKDSFEAKIVKQELEHSYVWLCYPGSSISSGDEAAEDIMQSIFGQGMDSRLFTEVREKKGLVYSIQAGITSYRDTGAMIISFSTRSENVAEAIKTIEIEINKIKEEFVELEELESARNKYRAASYAISESSYALAQSNLTRRFYNLCSIEELEARSFNVTREEIRNIANKLFDGSKKLTLICEAVGVL
jgi:predicted Zn-dependent peptidase